MTDTINFEGVTYGRVPPENVLDGAKEEGLKEVIVLGYTADNEEYFASSMGSSGDNSFLCHRFIHYLLESESEQNY